MSKCRSRRSRHGCTRPGLPRSDIAKMLRWFDLMSEHATPSTALAALAFSTVHLAMPWSIQSVMFGLACAMVGACIGRRIDRASTG